ncbi:MAG: LPS translocon maturation chaperone LptM [bacterium]
MKTTETLLIVILASLLLSACGQKGPLYLPEEQTASSSQGEDADSEEKDKEEQSDSAE